MRQIYKHPFVNICLNDIKKIDNVLIHVFSDFCFNFFNTNLYKNFVNF